MTKKTRVIVAIVVIAVVALVGIALSRGLSSPSDVTLPLITWNETILTELKGTPVVLNFWTTWCPSCRTELPHLGNVAQQSEGEIKVIAINVGESASRVQDFFGDYEPTMIIALDGNGEVFVNYCQKYNNPRGYIPFTLFVDSEGTVRYAKIGAFTSEEELRDALRDVLGVSIP
jgi:thiol-disulfide isomerase/thioredoxin